MTTKIPALLTPEDSKRVADALIDKINEADFNIARSANEAILSVMIPRHKGWYEDWFPLTIDEVCNKIAHGVIEAAYHNKE